MKRKELLENINTTDEKKRFDPLNIIIIVLIVLIAVVLCYSLVFDSYIVKKNSMDPTIKDGDSVTILKLGEPQRGDIVVFLEKKVHSEVLIKRVVAVGGDTFRIEDGRLFLSYFEDGKRVHKAFSEDYVLLGNIEIAEMTVPEGEFYVLGDNRQISFDSSEFGAISKKSVIGRVVSIKHKKS